MILQKSNKFLKFDDEFFIAFEQISCVAKIDKIESSHPYQLKINDIIVQFTKEGERDSLYYSIKYQITEIDANFQLDAFGHNYDYLKKKNTKNYRIE
jgi:hypothetical protein